MDKCITATVKCISGQWSTVDLRNHHLNLEQATTNLVHAAGSGSVTMGGRVAHPWKGWGKFWKEGGERRKGKTEARKRENGEEKIGNCQRGGEKLEMKGGKVCGKRAEDPVFFFFFACHF